MMTDQDGDNCFSSASSTLSTTDAGFLQDFNDDFFRDPVNRNNFVDENDGKFECTKGVQLVDDVAPGNPRKVVKVFEEKEDDENSKKKPVMEFGQAKLTFTVIKPIPRSMLKIDLKTVAVSSATKKENFYDSDNETDDASNRLSQSEIDEIFQVENEIFASINKIYGLASFEVGESSSFYTKNDYSIRKNVVFNFKRFEINILHNFFIQLYLKLFKTTSKKPDLCFEFSLDLLSYLSPTSLPFRPCSYGFQRFPLYRFSMGSLVDLHNFYEHASTSYLESERAFTLEINFMRKHLIIRFCYKEEKYIFYKLQISFHSIKWMMIESPFEQMLDKSSKNLGLSRIVLDLHYVPLLFKVTKETVRSDEKPREHVERIPNIIGNDIDPHLIGLSRTILLEFRAEHFSLTPFLYLGNICKTMNKKSSVYYGIVETHKSSIDYAQAIEYIEAAQFPFAILYALYALFSKSYKVLDSLVSKGQFEPFMSFIRQQNLNDKVVQSAVEDSIFALKNASRDNEFIDYLLHFQAIFEKRSQIKEDEEELKSKGDKGNYVIIRRATLSMGHLEFSQGIPLLKSRFTTFANVEYCIRVQVIDDNNEHLNGMRSTGGPNNVKLVMKRRLLEGIKMGGRVYEFLGSSTSQMRDHGVIFYATDDKGLQAQDIRTKAGDLSAFKHFVAKYVARLGLIFSQSMGSFDVKGTKLVVIKDIEGDIKPSFGTNVNIKKDRYCFTDGIGFVSDKVARQFLPCLQLKESKYFPSAFQIRYGGCKGMLAAYPSKTSIIAIRPSMRKYFSKDSSLRILKYSYPRPVYLNRPLISILTQLRVPDDVFYDLFNDNTSLVANASLSDRAAIELIRTYSISFIPYERLSQAFVSLLSEPFFRSLVHYLIQYRLRELKNKGRIRVPYKNGRIAFGVVDEMRELEYGQVFFQYTVMDEDGRPTSETRFLEGTVMVTKFPCLQPGDVRKLRAVRPKNGELDHIKDCVVFPARGPRPHPDEMGGSDLDGDEYAIFWDSPLIFPLGNFPSMIFPYGKNQRKDDGINMVDIVDFYCEYFIHNNIGKVANNHLMFSDLHPDGLMAQECDSLAMEYSISLDFQKTGYYEQTSSMYQFLMRPDFMDNQPHEDVYLSKRILGQFFRHCSLVEKVMSLSELQQTRSCVTRDNVDIENNEASLSDQEKLNRRFIIPGWQKYREDAEEVYTEYVLKMREILDQLDIPNETIVLSDVYDEKPDVSKVLITKLFEHFRDRFNQQCLKHAIPKRRFKRKKKAAAPVEKKDGANEDEADDSDDNVIYSSDEDEGEEQSADRRQYYAKHHERNVLISAWYAIVFEKLAYHQGYPLYGLPWLMWSEMMYLSRYIYYQTHQQKINLLRDSTPAAIIDHIASLCPMFKEEVLLGADVEENKTLVGNSFHYKVIKVLGSKWFEVLRNTTYGKVFKGKFTLSINSQQVGEADIWNGLIDNFIDNDINRYVKRLSECVRRRQQLNKYQVFKLNLLSKTFNGLMSFLFTLCSESNRQISNADIERVFLLKYVVFSHKFMSKFDNEIDMKFSQVLMADAAQKSFDDPSSCASVFIKELEDKFQTFVSPQLLSHESAHFNILVHPEQNEELHELLKFSKEKRIDYLQRVYQKLQAITGLEKIEIKRNQVRKLDLIISSRSGEKSEDVDPIRMNVVYVVDCVGYPHAVQILKILLGHVKFTTNIFNRFEVAVEPKEPNPSD